ncbi:MAG: ribosomal L7Ae/L30e/S12e/Gadd45 family protein [Paracholeplasma sp.]|jgi:ribosomal protein L7Ae-like RNA K-turn-binding protein|uniref:Ribosomal protein L7Ae/L30e/S12e/Gadd45 n=1 Tax=Acholeplasma brassicae TaxID=61635 RepID=U4KSW1_9MOLU|nr:MULTISPECIES: ribosomal L7Ae/L30e/S12e/Gadd45 family protein [Paracholeplasma]MDY3195560.1 ribosomal L7Ae/L30e/S12e/Gadd45 family protein [Paracholeplasma sp.]CCV65629.1 Ribosomal protein L7Ae/L30e/S12e/Gadd45 [Paracholeplasma brassicae]HBT59411.1 50S ribosomal protein L7ae-like protein [Acholeplasmataceae bacterium]
MLKPLGIANSARKLVSGTDFVVDAIRSNKAKLVFLANDASDNTKKKVRDKASFYGVEIIEDFDTNSLSKEIGKKNIKAIAIIDQGFANMFKK